jgi:hypothetical protein
MLRFYLIEKLLATNNNYMNYCCKISFFVTLKKLLTKNDRFRLSFLS